ncbi:MAG: hypothetical protein K2H20_02850, partial [Bacilli bacterium]|nr:hypothetical protein [Bacilli bacterium]
SNNPIVLDQNKPMGIYLDTLGFPKVETDIKTLDNGKLDLFAREYFNFVLWDNLISSFRENVDTEKEQVRIEKFLTRISNLDGHRSKTIEDYARAIKNSRDAFLEAYMKYIQTGEIDSFIDKLEVPFIMVEYSIKKFKVMLNNNSFFAVVADNQEVISTYSCRAINNIVSSRINGDISMNVATDPDKWKTYYAQNGQLAEYVHDYGVIELDNSLNEHVKKLKKNFYSDDE